MKMPCGYQLIEDQEICHPRSRPDLVVIEATNLGAACPGVKSFHNSPRQQQAKL
jgi:hypothetical protein